MPTINKHSKTYCFLCSRRQGDRHGSLYLSVLGVAMIVSAIGMSALTVARINLRSTSWRQDRREARILADSALELGAGIVMQDTAWRSSFQNGQENPSTPMPLGNGAIAWKLEDGDGNLDNDSADPVRLYGIGRVGQSVYTKSVLLEPTDAGLSCLEASFHTTGQIYLDDVTWTTDQFASTNYSGDDAIGINNAGILVGNGEAVGTINSSAVTGTRTEGITPRIMPDSTGVFEYYKNNGTWIDISDVPGGTPRLIEGVVLSPGNNPYGSRITNPQGIYVIDCKNQNLRVKLVRLVGTLVLLNTGSGSDLDNDQHWEPAVRNFPVLMVDGNMIFNWHAEHPLRESLLGVNYNPAHTPYEGQSDADQSDEYPALIKGLIYVSGNLTVQHQCIVEGVVVTGSVTPNAAMTLTYDSVFLDNPPPGFGSGNTMTISAGSWRREVSD